MAVYKDKKTGKWYFRIYVDDPLTGERKQISRSGFELKRDAIDAEVLLSSQFQNKQVRLSELKFTDLVEEYLAYQKKRVKPTTYVNYIYMLEKHILPFLDKYKVNDINRLVLEQIYKYLDNLEITNEYKNKILARLTDIFRYAEDQYDLRIRILNTFPPFTTSGTIDKKRIVIYDLETFNKFISHCRDELEKTLFKTMFYTGARIGEIRALTWNDISLDNNQIRINKQVTTKIPGKGPTITTPKTVSSVRNVQIPDILVEQLNKWFIDRYRRPGFKKSWQVFGDQGFITENRVRRMVKQISELAEVPYITLHGFRHSYTTMLYNMNVDPKIMQAQAGHSSINVTLDLYTHIEEEKAKKTIVNLFKTQGDK